MPIPEKISLNVALRKNKFWLNRKKDLYYKYVLAHLRNLKIKPINENLYPIDLIFVYTFKGKTLDTTNCGFMSKLIEDGFRDSGFLKNDDLRYVESSKNIVKKGKIDEVKIIIK